MILLLAVLLQETLFEDPLSGPLKDGWTWLRDQADSRKHEKDGLHLKVRPGTLWEKANSARNVLLRGLPSPGTDGPIAVEARVSSDPKQTAEQAGVLLYLDDDNYVKLVRENLEQTVKIVFAVEVGGQGTPLAVRADAAPAHTLRLTWSGAQIAAEMKVDGAKKWTSLGYTENPFPFEHATKVRAGLAAHGGPKDAERWAVFKDFRLSVPPPE